MIIELPVVLIKSLRNKYPKDSDELVECEVINYDGGYSDVKLKVKGMINIASSYGYFYINRTDLDRYLKEGENKMEKQFKYYYGVIYQERNLKKVIGSDKEFNEGDYLVVESNSQKFAIVKVEKVYQFDSYPYELCPFERRIICKIEDKLGELKEQLAGVQKEIKALNKVVADKYLILLINHETNSEVEEIRNKFKELLNQEKALKEEIEKYE